MFDPNKRHYTAVEVNKDLAIKTINDLRGRVDAM